MINSVNLFYPIMRNYVNKSSNVYSTPVFTGNPALVSGEKGVRKVEFFFRRMFNKINDGFESKEMQNIYKEFLAVDEKSEIFIDKLIIAGRKFGCKKEVEINIESGLIEKIAKSGKSHIFIMNHDRQAADPEMLAIFNTLLCQEYKRLGLATNCPRPKIILNEDILLSMNSEKRKVFEKVGAVGIDADLYSNDNARNARALLPLLRGFMKDKVNIFIFPEGKLAGRKVPLKQKFQQGAAEMINKLAGKKGEVNVVPLGFAYNNGSKKNLASIHIGKPVVFRMTEHGLTSSKGNVDSEFASKHYKKFFLTDDSNGKVITDNGIPVEGKDLPAYISGILCENLDICKKEAQKLLPSISLNEKVLIV